ncbi:MAG: flagellar type III secretion system protein FliQ [Anaerolineae bacterium]|jgi:flagellar biosynthetic protein FliQ|nr:flagellar type III secretion system protein FliQ [Anaerolineae bacterium]HOO16761.1 flagellar biosynthetic protein FliQ [Phycisphaerae bacterium]HPC21108.1 flagellar biosynthetic protein FliQ [Phycisphaerae bacterium]
MDMTAALDLGREALLVSLIIAAPVLGVGVVVGLVISVIQTVTQLNDQTLALVPKIVAMVAATMLLVPWLATRLIDYAQAMFAGI